MDILNPHIKDKHDGTEIVAKKKHEYKFIGSSIRRKGQTLFALDSKKFEVYVVPMQKKTALNMDGEELGQWKATVSGNDPMLWALNKDNAIRKFKLSVDSKYRDKVH